VDRIVQERLAREKAKYADYDKFKEDSEKLAEIESANQTELQKVQAQAAKDKEDREAAERKVQEQQVESQALLRRSQVETAAIKAGAVDPADVHALLSARDFKVKKDDKELAVTIGDDGQVTGVEEVVKAFLEEKPNLVGNTPPPPGDGGPRTPVQPKDRQAQIKEAEDKGDYATAMALKNQQLAEVREKQQAGGQ
jgi:hypothetical protein